MAVNQALIESARRMYAAEKGVVDRSGLVEGITSAAGSVATAFVGIKKEAAAQQEKNKADFKSQVATYEKIKGNPEALKEWTAVLDEYQSLYNEGSKESTRGFGIGKKNKETRSLGADKMNEAMAALDAFQMDLQVVDQTRSYYDNLSEANTTMDLIADNRINSPDAANNLKYNPKGYPPGIYTEDLTKKLGEGGKPELVRLSELKPLVKKFTEGISLAGDLMTTVANSINKDWDAQLKGQATGKLDELINNRNFSSLLFDNINDFNFAKEHLRANGVNMDDANAVELEMEKLREEYKSNPEKLKGEWKASMLGALEEDWTEAKALQEDDSSEGRARQRTPLSELQIAQQENFARGINAGGIVMDHKGFKYKPKNGKWVKLDVDDKPIEGYVPITQNELIASYKGLTAGYRKMIKADPKESDKAQQLIDKYSTSSDTLVTNDGVTLEDIQKANPDLF